MSIYNTVRRIFSFTNKIDGEAVNGLNGTHNSLSYRIHTIEKHNHGRERWFGKLAVQTATDWADNNIVTPFRAISGNNNYGSDASDEALVIGTGDTPTIPNYVYYDIHRILIVAASVTTVYKLRIIYGTGTMADAIGAGQYSTTMCKIDPAIGETPATPTEIMTPRCICGSDQIWIQAWNATNNATIDFFVGWHEYEG